MNQIGCHFVLRLRMNTAAARASAGKLIRSVSEPVDLKSGILTMAMSTIEIKDEVIIARDAGRSP